MSPIPDALSYEQPRVLSFALSIAACGLFQNEVLAPPYRRVDPMLGRKASLVQGGSKSVESNPTRLASIP